MSQLIPTFTGTLNNRTQALVNARDLYSFLDSKQEFANWMRNAIADYGFIEGEEFLTNLSKTSGFFGGRPKTEYHISLDMAKELAMVQRSDKGRQARRYFIQCEKQLVNLHTLDSVACQLRLENELLKARPLWGRIVRYKRLGLKTSEIAKIIERAPSTVRWHVRQMTTLGIAMVDVDTQHAQLALEV